MPPLTSHRVADLIAMHGSVRAAAMATGIALSTLYAAKQRHDDAVAGREARTAPLEPGEALRLANGHPSIAAAARAAGTPYSIFSRAYRRDVAAAVPPPVVSPDAERARTAWELVHGLGWPAHRVARRLGTDVPGVLELLAAHKPIFDSEILAEARRAGVSTGREPPSVADLDRWKAARAVQLLAIGLEHDVVAERLGVTVPMLSRWQVEARRTTAD